jgi:hypothetical protein
MLHGAGIFTNIYPKNHPNVGEYTIITWSIWVLLCVVSYFFNNIYPWRVSYSEYHWNPCVYLNFALVEFPGMASLHIIACCMLPLLRISQHPSRSGNVWLPDSYQLGPTTDIDKTNSSIVTKPCDKWRSQWANRHSLEPSRTCLCFPHEIEPRNGASLVSPVLKIASGFDFAWRFHMYSIHPNIMIQMVS